MSQIEELQRRINAAMGRIGTGIEALGVGAAAAADPELRSALDEERLANAQLEERIKTLKAQHIEEIDALRSALDKAEALPPEDPEKDQLRIELGKATAALATVEAARAELAEAKAALDNSDEVDALKSQIEVLKGNQDAVEEAESLRAEVAQLSQIADRADEMETELRQLRGELADSEKLTELSAELEMLRAERASHGAAMSRLDDDLQRMRKANEQLRETVDELRAAAQDGLTDADLLNRATAAELEATRAAQATDAAEAHAVLARLEPLLSQAKLTDGEVE